MRRSMFLSMAVLVSVVASENRRVLAGPPDTGVQVVLLTEGIVGGFVPPHIRYQAVIHPLKDAFEVVVMTQPARGAPQSFRSGILSVEQMKGLTQELERQGLWKLPVEVPAGCQDIYKADTSLAVLSGKRFWRNGGPEGCVHGTSKIQPNDKQIESFRATVAKVKKLVEKQATAKSDAATYRTALAAANKKIPKGGKKPPAPAPVDR